MIRITILLLLISLGASAQDFPQKIVGKQRFTDSVQMSRYKNNVDLDSVLSTNTEGKLMMKKIVGTGAAVDSITRTSGVDSFYWWKNGVSTAVKDSTGGGGGGGSAWSLTGNSGTTAGTNFIGTTDSVDFVVKTKALERLRVNANGALGVGTGTDYGKTGDVIYSTTATGSPIWGDGYRTQTENYWNYNIPFATTSFTDSTLVDQLDAATTDYYFDKGLWLNGTYTGSIANSRLVAWDYGFLVNGNFSQKLVFKVGDSATDLSVGIGVKAGQALATTINQIGYISVTLGDSTTGNLMSNLASSHVVSKASGLLINKGDVIELQINQIADSVQFFYRNLTNNNSYNLTRNINFSTNTQYRSLIGYPTVYFAKGNVKLISYSVYKQDFNYAFLGNSITEGYRTSSVTGFVNQLRAYTSVPINNMSRASTVSTDYVYQVKDNYNFTNKTVFISGICGNDDYGGISAATSKANYAAIVTLLRAKGNRIVHIDNPYRVTFLGASGWAGLVALNNWIDTTYAGIDTIIHIQSQTLANYPAWYTDGAHLNATGNTAVANIILNKVPDLFPLQQPLTSTTVDTSYYKPTVKDTSGREYKVSWNNFITDTSNAFITDITRTPGVDSFYYRKGGVLYGVKDSTGGGSSGITNGTTAMSGFTNTYIPYNNAGTIGQYAISGTGNVAMTTSPTFTTPALGTPASGTVTNLTGTASININGTVGATTPTTGVFTTVGIGTASPTYKLHVNGNSVMAQAASSAGVGDGYIWDETGSNYFEFLKRGSAAIGNMSLPVGSVELINYTNGSMGFINYGSGYIAFGTNGANERMRIDNSGNVGIDNTSPTSKLHTTSFATAYTASAVDITLTSAHYTIDLTVTGKTATLPTAVGISGRIYTIKLTASGTGTVATTSSQTIDGGTTYSLASQYKFVTVQSNNANWIVIGNN